MLTIEHELGGQVVKVDICDRLGHTEKERASGLCEGSFILQQHCMKLLPIPDSKLWANNSVGVTPLEA